MEVNTKDLLYFENSDIDMVDPAFMDILFTEDYNYIEYDRFLL
jgi:hypothetical protein